MRVSVVTPSLNQGQFIESTIRSVLQQDHQDVEHIVVDGGSTDETLSILKKYPHLRWVSEKDRGQSAALNKGFGMATGEIVAWLNSDDCYAANTLSDVARYFETHPDCMILYGDIVFMDREGRSLFTIAGPTIDLSRLISCPDCVRQPSFFWRRTLLDEMGGIDESLHLVMDFDFFLRVAAGHRLHYVPLILSHYRTYPETKSLSMMKRQLREFVRVYRKNGIRLTWPVLRFLIAKAVHAYGLAPIVMPLARWGRHKKERR